MLHSFDLHSVRQIYLICMYICMSNISQKKKKQTQTCNYFLREERGIYTHTYNIFIYVMYLYVIN